jgi:hypothetical protein
MAEWGCTPALRAEFSTAGSYAAFVTAERAGRVKLYEGRGVETYRARDFTRGA